MKNQVAKIIDDYRTDFNLSFRELEELSGISYSTIHLHLKGERNISFADIESYKKALNRAKDKKIAKLKEEGKENGLSKDEITFFDLIRPIPHYSIVGYIDLATGFVEQRDERPTELIVAPQDSITRPHIKCIAVIPDPKIPHEFDHLVGFFSHTEQKILINQYAYFKCQSPEGYKFGCVGVMVKTHPSGKVDILNRMKYKPLLYKKLKVLEAFRIHHFVWSDIEDIIRFRATSA